jgi:hypothetical protein
MRTQIHIEKIEELQRELEALPAYQADQVTKTDAVRRLLPRIETMQSKGYPLRVIASILSERGLEVTPNTLKKLIRDVGAVAPNSPGKVPAARTKSTRRRSISDNKGRATLSGNKKTRTLDLHAKAR